MNRFEKALDRIKKYVEPQDGWSEEDWGHYKTVCEALEIASEKCCAKMDKERKENK